MSFGGNNFDYFLRINWPKWHIWCSLNVCLCLVWRLGT